jgi:essential nuclear protein 1
MEVEETDPVDLETFDRFLPPTFDDPLLRTGLGGGEEEEEAPSGQSRNLADIILEKIAEKEAAQAANGNGFEALPEEEQAPEIPPRVLEVYTKIGHLLSRYKSGKLPKAFKIIPTLPPGMQQVVLELTQPQDWTPNAVYEATRIFISSNSSTAQYFVTSILLDTVREDIRENKKLNIHLYNALKKALYKPAAFFQGLLFPMLAGGNCTLREATIVASAITRVSVPVDHSAIAISRCCDIAIEQMARDPDSAGPTNLCIKAFLEKKYALPYKTVDDLVEHFLRFRPQTTDNSGGMEVYQTDNYSKLPVIWHQCFLVFAQRYRDNISEEQRESLLDLLMVRGHSAIGPEIRRELLAGRGRGVLAQEPTGFADGGDNTLMAVDAASGMVFG